MTNVCDKLFKILIVCCVLAGILIIKYELVNFNKRNHIVSVRGLSEKNIKADRVIWVLPIKLAGNNLEDTLSKIQSDMAKTVNFLKKKGIKDSNISEGIIKVYDKLSQKYYDDKNLAKRFSISSNIIVKTDDVEIVDFANKSLNELINSGVIISYKDYSHSGPKYFFTKLNEVKPEMLAEATKEAKKAAEQFALNSGSKIEGVKSISQGIFSIYARESDEKSNEKQFIDKVVRVVTNAQYYLE